MELPKDLQNFRLPAALDKRLHQLLDRQDSGVALSEEERAAGEGRSFIP